MRFLLGTLCQNMSGRPTRVKGHAAGCVLHQARLKHLQEDGRVLASRHCTYVLQQAGLRVLHEDSL